MTNSLYIQECIIYCALHLPYSPINRPKTYIVCGYHMFRICTSYSWGSTVLSFLYGEMCKAVNVDVDGMRGCVILLQT